MPAKLAATLATTDLPCPLWRRLLALVYDLLIVVAIVMVVGLLCQLATGGQLIHTVGKAAAPIWYQLLQALVVMAYFISSWRRGGQTVGMRPWRIRVTSDDGGTPSLQQALIGLHATLWTLLIVWAAWFAVALFDPRRRAVHDFAAHTEIRQLA